MGSNRSEGDGGKTSVSTDRDVSPFPLERHESYVRGMELFKAATEYSDAGLCIYRNGEAAYINPAFSRIAGYSSCESCLSESGGTLLGAVVSRVIGDGDSPKRNAKGTQRFETKIRTRDGEERWIAVTAVPIGKMEDDAFLTTIVDITSFREREEALRRSEERYKAVFEFAPDSITIYRPDGLVLDANPAMEELETLSREEMVNKLKFGDDHPPELQARYREIREKTLRDGEWFGEFDGVRSDGRPLTCQSHVRVAEIGGEKVVISLTRDITERKEMEEQIRLALREKEILLREIHHRVKNNMQIISTLLKLQSRNAEDEAVKALFRESQNRILSMAMIHEKLYQSEGIHRINLRSYIDDLTQEVLLSFGQDEAERVILRKDIDDLAFGMDAAIPCGLIIIELLSNSLKYAFPDGRKGEISIVLCEDEGGLFRLTAGDNGIGLPEGLDVRRLKSLGLRLVSDLAQYQLRGEIQMVSSESGTETTIYFKEKSSKMADGDRHG